MKTIIPINSDDAKKLIKSMNQKCTKRVQIPYKDFESVFDLTNQTHWNEAMSLFYLFGCQRYSGNHVGQSVLAICKRGSNRIIEILANYGQNCKLGYAQHGEDTIAAFVEAYYVDALLTTETVDSIIAIWSRRMAKWKYRVVKWFESNNEIFTKIAIVPMVTNKPSSFPGSNIEVENA